MGYFGIPFRNGVPIGLGSVASFGAQQFDLSSLFIGGTAGTWYDPSDPTTLFTTSAGTTPCAVPGAGSQVLVGLMLDKSQGAPGALGAELVTNGDFSGGTTGWSGWNTNAQISVTNGQMTVTQPVGGNQVGVGNTVAYATVVGRAYQISLDIISYNNSGLEPQIRVGNFNGAVNTISFNLSAGTGRKTGIFVANSTATFVNVATSSNAGNTITFDNISVREIPGNHAIAFNDTTARPELSARVNLLTYSEDWTNAVWQKLQSGTGVAPVVTNNFATAPDGTQTAIRVQFNLGATPATAVSRLYQNAADNVTVARTKTVWAKTNDNSTKSIYTQGPQSGYTLLTVTPAWTLFTISDTSTTVSAYSQMQLGLDGSQGTSTTADILFWHPDIRQTNIGSAIPSYQRIADQYTYDSNGFPSYLRFDGVDDSMYTPASINFSGTDKMSVFAGVRKNAETSYPTLVEMSVAIGTNNGSFAIYTSGSSDPRYPVYLQGTTQAGYEPQTYAAPITNVLAFLLDIGASDRSTEVIPRINGVVNQTNPVATGTAGTGNFGTYPLFIGSRNNASNRFNGHLYSLIIAGTQLQSGSITATEQWVAGKTGVQI